MSRNSVHSSVTNTSVCYIFRMSKDSFISENQNIRKSPKIYFSNRTDYAQLELALNLKMAHNPEPQTQRGSTAMSLKGSVPDNAPGMVELYVQRFIQADLREDIDAVIDEVWHKDSPLSFDQKLEIMGKIAMWKGFGKGFNVNSFPLPHFQACQYAMRETAYQPNTDQFFIDRLESMNYAAKVTVISYCLLEVREARQVIEKILETATEWQIVSGCKKALKSIYRKHYPEELPKLDFEIADRANSKTKPDWTRANTIDFVPLTEEMIREFKQKQKFNDIDNQGSE